MMSSFDTNTIPRKILLGISVEQSINATEETNNRLTLTVRYQNHPIFSGQHRIQ